MAADALDILDELVECEVSILQPHIRLVVYFSLEVCQWSDISHIRIYNIYIYIYIYVYVLFTSLLYCQKKFPLCGLPRMN